MTLDPTVVAGAPRRLLETYGWRQIAPRYDPLSGEGARIHGGRFNPPDSFPVLYLCLSRECAVAELTRQRRNTVLGVEGLLPRALYRYEVVLDAVLDLTDPETLTDLGVRSDELVGEDRSLPRLVGETAHAAGFQAIRCPSATGVGEVLAVFPELIGLGRLEPSRADEWTRLEDLQAAT